MEERKELLQSCLRNILDKQMREQAMDYMPLLEYLSLDIENIVIRSLAGL
ncbi:MAG: hypothetical protein GX567_13675 [Clostridia bacterium]|nr:hypothetical protein [Clostridia bacterium]